MIEFTCEIVGERSVTLRFETFGEEVRAAIQPIVEQYGRELYDAAVAAAPKRTGKLARTIDYRFQEDKQQLRAIVGFTGDYAKAATVNYGSHRGVEVKAHALKLGHVYSRAISPESVAVKAYSRHVNLEGTKFLQTALAEVAPGFLAALREAIAGTVNQSNSEVAT